MEFLVLWWHRFFLPKELLLFKEATTVHFYSLPKPTQNFSKRKALIMKIIKNESKKVLEKCVLQY